MITEHDGLVWRIASRYAYFVEQQGAADMEDLLQAGRLAVQEALKTWDSEKGAFTTWAKFYIMKAVRECVGIRGKVWKLPPASLDAPILQDEELTLIDTIADPDAPEGQETLLSRETSGAVRAAIERLPETQRIVARGNLLECVPLAKLAREYEIPMHKARQAQEDAIRALRYSLRSLDAETDWHRKKGVQAFQRTRSSVVEDLVIYREERREA